MRPIASAYFKYVTIEAITTRASILISSIPINEIFAQRSTTMPLPRIRSTTSARLDESVDLFTSAIPLAFMLSDLNQQQRASTLLFYPMQVMCQHGKKSADNRSSWVLA